MVRGFTYFAVVLAAFPMAAQQSAGDADVALPVRLHGDAPHLAFGYTGADGSYAALSWKTNDLFGHGETTSLTLEAGIRTRRIEWGLSRATAFGSQWTLGMTAYVRRFHFNQERDASLSASDRDIQQYQGFWYLKDTLDFTSTSYGLTGFARRPMRGGRAHFDLLYGYDISSERPISAGTADYFAEYTWQTGSMPNRTTGIRTSRAVPSWTWNTVNNPVSPTKGFSFTAQATVAGIGGDIHFVEPSIETRYYRAGLRRRDVIALRARGRIIHGFGGVSAPPYDRYFMGGEDDVRGFNSGAVSPVAEMPALALTPALHPDGTPLVQTTIINNVPVTRYIYVQVPIYRILAPGGDMNVVANAEYRAALKGPFTLVLFGDLGMNRIVFPGQLRVRQGFLDAVNEEYGYGVFDSRFLMVPGSQRAKISTGAELRIRVPGISVPIRFYWAWNPRTFKQYLPVPILYGPSSFPNETSYLNAIYQFSLQPLYSEQRNMLRFSIGRTF